MSSLPFRRSVAIVAGALLVAVVATACSAQNASGSAAVPRVGDCWKVSYSDAAQSEDWEGSAAVPCTAKHQSYTYAVTKLARTFTGSWLDSTGKPRADVDRAAFAACHARELALLPQITPREALFYPTYYVPAVAQWNSGARWVRCDLTEIRVGSEVAHPVLTSLPSRFGTLMAEVRATPRKFALCEDDVFNNGPDGDQTTYADCTGPADWTFETRLTLPGTATARYPGQAVLKQTAAPQCAAAVHADPGHDVVATTPSKTAWVRDGVRTVDCWLNNN